MDFEIIDFHTHPFLSPGTNICSHQDYCPMDPGRTRSEMETLGVAKICGSVIGLPQGVPAEADIWERLLACNDEALRLQALYGGFYIPGFHVHPGYVRESCAEIERMHKLGVRLIGELVPYMHGWTDYASPAFSEILDTARQYSMIVSFHSMNEDAMDQMVAQHPDVIFVAAHPGEYGEFMRHMERMKTSENYYLDLSGYGIFRYGMLRHAIDTFGPERFLFGSDFPTCNTAMYIGGVLLDPRITDREKELIFFQNAKRLLGLA